MAKGRVTIYPARLRRSARRMSVGKRREIAEEVAGLARATAPRRSGDFADSIGVRVEGTQVLVVDEDIKAIHKEYGTSYTPAHGTLTNAAAQFGRYSGMRPRGR